MEAVTALFAQVSRRLPGRRHRGLAGADLGCGFGLLTRRLGMPRHLWRTRSSSRRVRRRAKADQRRRDAQLGSVCGSTPGAGNANSDRHPPQLTYKVSHCRRSPTSATWQGLNATNLQGVSTPWQHSARAPTTRLTSQLDIPPRADPAVRFLSSGSGVKAKQLAGADPSLAALCLTRTANVPSPIVIQ